MLTDASRVDGMPLAVCITHGSLGLSRRTAVADGQDNKTETRVRQRTGELGCVIGMQAM